MNITVYLGANEGNDPSLRKAVQELGTWIGESGNSLVYGGSKSGLMGEIAESVLRADWLNGRDRQKRSGRRWECDRCRTAVLYGRRFPV